MNAALLLVGLVAAQRAAELVLARRNARVLLARGAVEHGRRHYPLFVLLHAAWLLALARVAAAGPPLAPAPLALFLALQGARVWVIATLGGAWTTRILTPPGTPLVHAGPYRWVRHPNYLVVALEVPLLPLVFGAWRLALLFGGLNLALLAWRIGVEERALAPRRVPASALPPLTARGRRGGSSR